MRTSKDESDLRSHLFVSSLRFNKITEDVRCNFILSHITTLSMLIDLL